MTAEPVADEQRVVALLAVRTAGDEHYRVGVVQSLRARPASPLKMHFHPEALDVRGVCRGSDLKARTVFSYSCVPAGWLASSGPAIRTIFFGSAANERGGDEQAE